MERRITEVKEQYQKLKEECAVTVDNLNKLIQACGSHIDSLGKLDSKERKLNSKYFLVVSQFQHDSHQKVVELNLELEEHLLENKVTNLEHFKETTTYSSLRNSESSPCSTSFSTIRSEPPVQITHVPLKLPENNESSINKEFSLLILDNSEDECIAQLPKVENLDNESDIFITPPLETSSVLNESTSTNTEIFFDVEDNSPYENEGDSLTIVQQPVEDSRERVSYISDSLKLLPLMTLEEKYVQSIPKSHMPDITLKPSDVKRFVVADDLLDRTDIDTISSNDSSKHEVVLKEPKSERKKLPNDNQALSKKNYSEYAVFEIESRPAPLVGDICMIGFVESPSNFYIQVSDENSILIDVIATQLAEINNNTSLCCTTKLDTMYHLGTFCTLQIDGTWYRAEVLDWLQDSDTDQVYILLIDYGSQYSVSYTSLRPLPLFCRTHTLAQKCYLAYLYPPGSTSEKKLSIWPAASKEAFLNYCGDLDTSDFRITYIQPSTEDKNIYEIDIVKLSDDVEDKSIGDILINAGLADQIIDDVIGVMKHSGMCSQILKAHGCGGVTLDMSREEVLDIYFERVDEEPSNINEAVMKYNPRDEAETCRNLRPNGTCYKGASCKFRHVVLRSGYTNDREAIYWRAFSSISLPKAGEDISLTISHIVDIQCFYAQLRNEANGIRNSINDLINIMNEPPRIKKYQKFQQVPSLSEMVIAKHWNNYWYRAQVRDVDNADIKDATAEVYFVDFGDILLVAVADLRIIMAEFLELPFQAVECRLYNVRHKQDKDPTEEKTYFESQLLGVTLNAHVVAVPGHLQVLLENSSGQDVGLQLIDKGFGELNTEHYYPAPDELILID